MAPKNPDVALQPLARFKCEGKSYVLYTNGKTAELHKATCPPLPEVPHEYALGYRDAASEARDKAQREKEEAERRARVKHFRVRWTEEYEQVREAESEEQAIEERDDEDAFVGCVEVTAQEVEQCPKCKGTGCGMNGSTCEGGWVPVVEAR